MNKFPGEAMLGVDLGTTAVKVSAFEFGGTRQFDAAEEYPLLHPQPGWEVQDPIRILAALDACLAQCRADITTAELTPVGVALSSAMHGLIGLDAELRPITELIT